MVIEVAPCRILFTAGATGGCRRLGRGAPVHHSARYGQQTPLTGATWGLSNTVPVHVALLEM
jgi:hypothetical protein